MSDAFIYQNIRSERATCDQLADTPANEDRFGRVLRQAAAAGRGRRRRCSFYATISPLHSCFTNSRGLLCSRNPLVIGASASSPLPLRRRLPSTVPVPLSVLSRLVVLVPGPIPRGVRGALGRASCSVFIEFVSAYRLPTSGSAASGCSKQCARGDGSLIPMAASMTHGSDPGLACFRLRPWSIPIVLDRC